MKVLIQAIRWLLVILIIAVIFLMMLYHASGHNIPFKTDATYVGIIVGLIALHIALGIFKRRL